MNDRTRRRARLLLTSVVGGVGLVAFAAPAGAAPLPDVAAEPVAAPTTEPIVPATTPTAVEEAPAPASSTTTTTTTTTTASPAASTRAAAVTAAATGMPSVSVTPTSGLNPAGGSTIAATGSGFHPTANNGFGIYVVFGPVDPATYFSDANRFLAAMWLHSGGAGSGSPGQGELNADGTFSTSLPAAGGAPLTARYTDGNGAPVDCMTTQCYVITIAAHGVSDRTQDTCTPVAFAGGTATPTVDRSCHPVAISTGQPTASGTGATDPGTGTSHGTQAAGTGTAGSGRASGSSSRLPLTGAATTPLGALGLALVAVGLVLVQRARSEIRVGR